MDGTFVLVCTLHALLRVRDDGEHIEHKLVQILDFFGVDAGRALRKQGGWGLRDELGYKVQRLCAVPGRVSVGVPG